VVCDHLVRVGTGATAADGNSVGIDVGLKTFATLSDGQEIANPRFFRQEEDALTKAQHNHQVALDTHKAKRAELTKQVKEAHADLDEQGVWQVVSQDASERAVWKERQKRRKVVARTHERVRWKRDDFAHQYSRRLVNEFDVIVVEDLSVRIMVQNGHLAKSIQDAAWSQFATLLRVKAEWATRAFIAVNPAYTSQDCSGCGDRKTDLTLADRTYQCLSCGLVIDRDLNAARNILALGRQCLASASKPLRLRVGSRHSVSSLADVSSKEVANAMKR
jgi:putative transposase